MSVTRTAARRFASILVVGTAALGIGMCSDAWAADGDVPIKSSNWDIAHGAASVDDGLPGKMLELGHRARRGKRGRRPAGQELELGHRARRGKRGRRPAGQELELGQGALTNGPPAQIKRRMWSYPPGDRA